jgi:hypothetical protein
MSPTLFVPAMALTTMDIRKYNFNTIQMLALTGIIMSAVAHLALLLVGRNIPNFWIIYPTWLGVFALGMLIKIFGNAAHEQPHDHGHQDHTH